MSVALFLKEFAADPRATGSVAPSSTVLAREIIRGLPLSTSTAVLEYGSGTGAFTVQVLEAIDSSCQFLAIESNLQFVRQFRKKFPNTKIHHGSVADVRSICDQHEIGQVDCIISGLPWAVFPRESQVKYLEEMMRVLKPGGQFVTFGVLTGLLFPASYLFAKMLPDYFSEVSRSPIVWRNVPPAYIYRCRR